MTSSFIKVCSEMQTQREPVIHQAVSHRDTRKEVLGGPGGETALPSAHCFLKLPPKGTGCVGRSRVSLHPMSIKRGWVGIATRLLPGSDLVQ